MYNIQFAPPDINDDDIEEVVDTLRSGWITTGPKTKLFENKIANYIGVNKAVCLNSATAAMELTLRILGVGPDDEVITCAYTYTSSASIIAHVGAKIVLIDTAPDSYEMDYQALERAITEKTKVVIPIDIAGVICNYKKIYSAINNKKYLFKAKNKLQELYNRVIVVADSAHAFGAKQNNILSGKIADFTCFSFHAVKNLTTAEGGAVVWRDSLLINDDYVYNKFMLYSLHGQTKDAYSKTIAGTWEYDIEFTGYKYNMTDITASIGLHQLDRYNDMIKRRHEIIAIYDKYVNSSNLKALKHKSNNHISSGHLYLINIPGYEENERNKLIINLANKGIFCNVHYKPLPMMTAYKKMGFDIINFQNAYNMYKNEISLPLHNILTNNEIEYIIKMLNMMIY